VPTPFWWFELGFEASQVTCWAGWPDAKTRRVDLHGAAIRRGAAERSCLTILRSVSDDTARLDEMHPPAIYALERFEPHMRPPESFTGAPLYIPV
jgi:hypothetical protein